MSNYWYGEAKSWCQRFVTVRGEAVTLENVQDTEFYTFTISQNQDKLHFTSVFLTSRERKERGLSGNNNLEAIYGQEVNWIHELVTYTAKTDSDYQQWMPEANMINNLLQKLHLPGWAWGEHEVG